MAASINLYGLTLTVRLIIAILLPIFWRAWWFRKGEDFWKEKYGKWFAKHGKQDHPAVIKLASHLYGRMFYLSSWLVIWLVVLLLIGILKGWGDSTSKIIYISSSFIGFLGLVGGFSAIKQTISGMRVVMNKYGGLGDQMKLHNKHDIGVHHAGWQGEVDILSSKYLTDRFTDLVIENDGVREYAIENLDRHEFYHTHMPFPINEKNRIFAIGKPGKDADPEKNVAKVEAVMGIAQRILEDDDYSTIKGLLADADDEDRKRISDVLKDLSADLWDSIRNPTVYCTDHGKALLRLPVRSWEDERDVRHHVVMSGLLDRFYEGT